MLEAYFDESERSNGTFAVAGFAFVKDQAKKFSREWRGLFGSYGICRMADLAARQGVFQSISEPESARLLKEAVKIINHRTAFGAIASCNRQEMNGLLPIWFGGFEDAYVVCCHLTMIMLGAIVSESDVADDIAYFFETGHRFQAQAHTLMGLVTGRPNLTAVYRHRSHAFMRKADAVPLQAADMLAWEATKYWDETAIKRVRPMRRSLVEMFREPNSPTFNSKKFRVAHVTGPALQHYAAQATQLGLAEWLEVARPPAD